MYDQSVRKMKSACQYPYIETFYLVIIDKQLLVCILISRNVISYMHLHMEATVSMNLSYI